MVVMRRSNISRSILHRGCTCSRGHLHIFQVESSLKGASSFKISKRQGRKEINTHTHAKERREITINILS